MMLENIRKVIESEMGKRVEWETSDCGSLGENKEGHTATFFDGLIEVRIFHTIVRGTCYSCFTYDICAVVDGKNIVLAGNGSEIEGGRDKTEEMKERVIKKLHDLLLSITDLQELSLPVLRFAIAFGEKYGK